MRRRLALCLAFVISGSVHCSRLEQKADTDKWWKTTHNVLKNVLKNVTKSSSGGRRVAPVVWVPGITSSPLWAKRHPTESLGRKDCEAHVPKGDSYYGLYANIGASVHMGCLLWQLKLRPPLQNDPEKCVRDAMGIQVDPLGTTFGTSEGAEVLNPWHHKFDDLFPLKLYKAMTQMWESLGLSRDKYFKFATYDWRKFGDKCWERIFFKALRNLIETTVVDTQERIILGCHSMGCPLVHVFLNQTEPDWKKKHIHEFLATGPAFAGTTVAVQSFIQGPTYDFVPLGVSTLARSTLNSMPSVYSLLPTQLGYETSKTQIWGARTIVDTPEKTYTVDQIEDGSLFKDIELDDDTADTEASNEEVADFAGTLTDRGCVCLTECGTDAGVRTTGVLNNTDNKQDAVSFFARPWCFTHGECGRRTWNPFEKRFWDHCDQGSTVIDAGPGFEFFPGVTASEASVENNVKSLQEQKFECLSDPDCTSFDTDGNFMQGQSMSPTDWRSMPLMRHGVLQGLYVKRSNVHECQKKLSCASRKKKLVCGSDGVLYVDSCALQRAQCWKTVTPEETDTLCKSTTAIDASQNGCTPVDTGRGFSYFPGCIPTKEHMSRNRIARHGFHMDQFEDECGIDPHCTGFDTSGMFYSKQAGELDPKDFEKTQQLHYGVYVKSQAVLGCQKPTDETGARWCIRPLRKTFSTKVDAENSHCFLAERLDYKDVEEPTAGPCRRYGGTGMHDVAVKTIQRARYLKPPGVPTTIMYISDFGSGTGEAWYFGDFLANGKLQRAGPGDGTVNEQSMRMPCEHWAALQTQPVKCTRLEYGGKVNHVGMLSATSFLEDLRQVMLQRDGDYAACGLVNGAYALPQNQNTTGQRLCRCAVEEDHIFCGTNQMESFSPSEFNIDLVLLQCDQEDAESARLKCSHQ